MISNDFLRNSGEIENSCEISDCEVSASIPHVLETEKEKFDTLSAVEELINQKKAPQVTKGLQL